MENLATDEVKRSEVNSVQANLQKVESWEIEMIGDFLLQLFHQHVITILNEFMVLKSCLREEFNKFLKLAENAQFKLKFQEPKEVVRNLGSLLYRTNFLINTPRGSQYYRIRSSSLYQYGNRKLKDWDDQRLNSDNFVVSTKKKSNANAVDFETVDHDDDDNNPELMECFKIADDAVSHPLEYQGSIFERRDDDFSLSSMGCFICLRNFDSPEVFEEHIQWHGDDSDFESLKIMKKLENSFFQLTYTVCKDSHYFCFNLSTHEKNVIIEKIIIVKTRSMFYVNNNRVPYAVDESGVEKFFVDSHLFNIYVEQPIVIVFRYKSNEAMRVVEQHHFMRCEEFPDVNFSIRANRLPNRDLFKAKISLLQYLPSNELKLALKQKFSNKSLGTIANEFDKYVENKQQITTDTMIQVWNLLLQIEDMDAIQKFACLMQRNVKFRCFGNEYSLQLKVKGRIFVENILSQYDEVLIIPETNEGKTGDEEIDWILSYADSKTGSRRQKIYNGVVERVSNNRVVILCYDKKLSDKLSYKVVFRPARLTLRYQYRALQLLDGVPTKLMQRYFFPVVHRDDTQQLPVQDLELFNPTIADNAEQLQAVRNIANGPCQNAPYIIFGPPGTGKTTTLVEAILQLYKLRLSTKILVTAGSNSACDEVALRLCKELVNMDDSRAMVRIYAKSNEKRQDNIDEELLEASNMYGAHFYPDITVLHEYRIVICTLSVVGRLSTGQFGKNDSGDGIFTHTFVDEVAASTATEVLVGIASTISPINHLIISGDHKQLGPILQSDKAHELGLGLSLMEHLLAQDCYRVDVLGNYNRSIQTRLKRNHRSHKEIVDLYSELYYDSELIPLANPADVDLASKWHFAPNPHYPVIFHSVFGQSMTGRTSVSLYNDRELEVVLDYVKDILCFGINGEKVKESDIGIISPYKKQYLRIQEELNSRRLFAIETGSVETFQGKEKPIIIVSFVRSFTNKLGFLDNPRRLNVTLSRAKSLLILIGNPKTLAISADFNHIIERCQINNTMVGARLHADNPLDEKTETSQRPTIENEKKNHGKDRVQQRMNKTNAKGNNKNKNGKQKVEVKNEKGANEVPQLGKQMKKRVTPISQQKQRQHFDKLQKLVTNDPKSTPPGKKSKNSHVDDVFNSLPDVPFKQLQIKFEKSSPSNSLDDFRNLESEMHEKMRKLRIKHPKSTVSNDNVKSSPKTEMPILKSDLPAPASKSSSTSSNNGSKASVVFNSDKLASFNSIPINSYKNSSPSLAQMENISNQRTATNPNKSATTANLIKETQAPRNAYFKAIPLKSYPTNKSATTANLIKETEAPQNAYFKAIPLKSYPTSAPVIRPENNSFTSNPPSAGVASANLRSETLKQPQVGSASMNYRSQTDRNNELYKTIYDWESRNLTNTSQATKKEKKSCIIA